MPTVNLGNIIGPPGPKGDTGPYHFEVNEAGELILYSAGDTAPNYRIDENGHLLIEDQTTVDLGNVVGDPGKSAYEFAQDGGYTGTEKEFTEKLAAEYPTFAQLRAAAPTNLLDNSDFTQFIAQAGLGGKHGSVVYAGDRWKLANGSINGELNSSGNGYTDIVITHSNFSACYLVQRSPLYNQIAGKSCTVAIEYADGNRYCANFTVGNETSGKLLGQIMFFSNDSDHFNFRITGNQSVSIKHIWILPGTFTLETMPEYRSKGFGPELSECMRYYQRYDARARNLPGTSATICYPFSFAMPMRIVPTITEISVPDGILIGRDNNTPVGASIYCTKEYSGDGHIIAEMSADL